MNPEQLKAYLDSEGTVCPFCGGSNWDGRGVEIDGEFAYQKVTCLTCCVEWVNAYKLHHVVELQAEE